MSKPELNPCLICKNPVRWCGDEKDNDPHPCDQVVCDHCKYNFEARGIIEEELEDRRVKVAELWNSMQPGPAETDKEKLASWMCDQGYATGHGDSMDDLLAELKEQIQPRPAVPDYAYDTVAEYESIAGFSVNDSFRIGWAMARTTNGMLESLDERSGGAQQRPAGCTICANGNDLPEGEYCRACGREAGDPYLQTR